MNQLNLQQKIYIYSFGLLLILATALVGISIWRITTALRGLNIQLMQTQISNIIDQIAREDKTLKDGGFADIPAVVQSTREAVAQRLGESLKFGQSGALTIVDMDKKIFFHKTSKKGETLSNTFVDDFIKNKKGHAIIKDNGKTRMAVYEIDPHWNWLLIAAIDTSEMLSARTSYLRDILIATSILFAIIGTLLWYIAKNIMNHLNFFRKSVDDLNESTDQIASGNNDLATRTQQQASSLEETASALKEITSSVQQTTMNSQKVAQLSNHAVSVAEEGRVSFLETQKAMSDISSSSRKIAEIVKLVEDIAFQTNILAINAAIEAAKAGEQGKGFAVVAIEVRDLAQKSAEAAKEIKGLISNSGQKVDAGEKLVALNNEKLQEIGQSIKQMAEIMNEISSASNEQYTSIEQMNSTISHLDSTNQQNATLVKEIASASEEMAAKANQMHDTISAYFSQKDD